MMYQRRPLKLTRNTGGKRRGGSSLVLSGKTLVVVLSVNLDVLQVPLGELLDVLVNGLDSTLFSGLLGRVVGVATSTVPLSLGQGLGVERGLNKGDARSQSESVTRPHLSP